MTLECSTLDGLVWLVLSCWPFPHRGGHEVTPEEREAYDAIRARLESWEAVAKLLVLIALVLWSVWR